jgi:Fe-Mn family superoxide dismutase
MTYTLPALGYAFDALEPYIDALTMQLHHDKHHQNAVDTLNKSIADTGGENKSVEELLTSISNYSTAVRNSAGSFYNHSQFWQILGPNGGQPLGKLADAINNTFGSLDGLKEKMNTAGTTRFGSGWAWLIVKDGKLEVCSTPNQDNPLMNTAEVQGAPILGIDVWEHAYYLKYHNKRPDYLAAIWNVINWDAVAKKYEAAL